MNASKRMIMCPNRFSQILFSPKLESSMKEVTARVAAMVIRGRVEREAKKESQTDSGARLGAQYSSPGTLETPIWNPTLLCLTKPIGRSQTLTSTGQQ